MAGFLLTALTAFVLVAPVELPDKTFVATLVLATRYRPLPVWLGVVAAFAVQCAIAVAAGQLLGLLPRRPVQLVAAVLFAAGAVVLLRGARRAEAAGKEQERGYAERAGARRTGVRAALASFAVLFTAEWGDLSQLLTAGLVASGRSAVPVFVGAFAALAAVSGAAVLLGRWLLRRVRLALVRYLAAGVCAVLAVVTAAGVW
ncbi:MAG TPA: TMEM165/GDT1 family protein [Micromonosporaceae bacterium]|nr:TMEM165/GDT1 family protein [Micromonosporaceae bacterium]